MGTHVLQHGIGPFAFGNITQDRYRKDLFA